jgi:hypothetical protein
VCKGVNQHECARSSRLGERPYPRGRRPASLQLGAPVPQSRAISYASLPSTPVIVTAPSAEQSHSTRMECSRFKRVTTDSVAGSACLKTTRTGGRRTGRAERGRGVHHLRGVGRGEPAVERCRQRVTGRYRRGHPRRLANGDVSAARRSCGQLRRVLEPRALPVAPPAAGPEFGQPESMRRARFGRRSRASFAIPRGRRAGERRCVYTPRRRHNDHPQAAAPWRRGAVPVRCLRR